MPSICKRLVAGIRHILHWDAYVSKHKKQEEESTLRGLALIAALALAVMSVLNIKQHSNLMLLSTSVSALFSVIGYWISRYKHKAAFLRFVLYAILCLFSLPIPSRVATTALRPSGW